jgi:hypothetical protein
LIIKKGRKEMKLEQMSVAVFEKLGDFIKNILLSNCT